MTRAWSFLALDDEEREFRGNLGYDDALDHHYSFDGTVPNHGHVAAGDLAVLRNSAYFLGCGWIEDVEVSAGTKLRLRCPKCALTGFKERRIKTPRFRCPSCRNEFDTPITEQLHDLPMYRAVYARTWKRLDPPFPVPSLHGLYKSLAAQHAIRELDLDACRRIFGM